MTPSTDYSVLQSVQSFRFPVYASAGLQIKANEVATRCEKAYNFLQGIFQQEPKILHQLWRPVADVENRAFQDLVPHAIGFAQEKARRRVAIGYGVDIHDHIIVR